jgi:hypothetical protein
VCDGLLNTFLIVTYSIIAFWLHLSSVRGSKISVRASVGVGNFPTLIFLRSQTQTHSKRIHFGMRFFITVNPKITGSFVCKQQNQCESEIGCGKFSYTDFSSLSNAPEAHKPYLCAGSVSLYLKPRYTRGFFFVDQCARQVASQCFFIYLEDYL